MLFKGSLYLFIFCAVYILFGIFSVWVNAFLKPLSDNRAAVAQVVEWVIYQSGLWIDPTL